MTPEELYERLGPACFSYDPVTGIFTHKARPSGVCSSSRIDNMVRTKFAGRQAGRKSHGYVTLRIRNVDMRAHRFVWWLTHGEWPQGILDHINGDRSDNRPENLRLADESMNRMNMRLRSDNASGAHGVFFAPSKNRWLAQICVRGKRKQLGSFGTFEEAFAARSAEQARHNFGPNHGASA